MHNSKLIEMFSVLDAKEIERFEAYLHSPLHSPSDKVIHLFELVKAEYPTYNSDNLRKEVVLMRLFEGKKKSDSSLRALMSQLTKLLEDFFAYSVYEQNEELKIRLQLEYLTNKNLKNIFNKSLKKTLSSSRKDSIQNIEHFYHKFRLNDIALQYRIVDENRGKNLGLQELMDSLDAFYVASKLKYACAILSRERVLNKTYELHLFEEVLGLAERNSLKNIIYVKFYYNVCKLLINSGNERHFYILKELMITQGRRIVQQDLRTVCLHLSNYCMKRIKQGDDQYLKELFLIYQEMLKKELFFVDKEYLMPHNYKNIVTAGLRLKEFQWIKQFIQKYKTKLHPSVREGVYNYSLAALYFELKNYDKAREHLMQSEFLDAYYQLAYKALSIKTYYELKEQEAIRGVLEATRIYLIRQKDIARNNRTAYQNFVKLVKKLLRVKPNDSRRLKNLQKEIKAAKPCADYPWLLDKVRELLGEE